VVSCLQVFRLKVLYVFLVSPIPHPFNPPLLPHTNNICWRVQIMKLLIMSFYPPPVISYLLFQNILLYNLFSNQDLWIMEFCIGRTCHIWIPDGGVGEVFLSFIMFSPVGIASLYRVKREDVSVFRRLTMWNTSHPRATLCITWWSLKMCW
jgi:hypothetical protein